MRNNRNFLNTHVLIFQLTIKDLQISYVNKSFETINPLLDMNSSSRPLDQRRSNSATTTTLNPLTMTLNPLESIPPIPSSHHPLASNNSATHPVELTTLQIIFPISSKDPLNQYRKMYDISKALHVNERTGLRYFFYLFPLLLNSGC